MARVAALVLDGFRCSSLAMFEDIIADVNEIVAARLAHQRWELEEALPFLRRPIPCTRLSVDGAPVRRRDENLLPVDAAFDDQLQPFDIVYLPETSLGEIVAMPAARVAPLSDWLRAAHEHGTSIVAQGASVAMLGLAGLLDGRRVSLPWSDAGEFRRRFPAARAETVEAATMDSHIGSASVMAATPGLICDTLAGYLPEFVATRLRREVMGNEYAPEMTWIPDSRAARATERSKDLLVTRATHWLALNYDARSSLAIMARELGASERTLSRRFVAATGMTPFAHARRLKLEAAARMLRRTPLRVDQIALRVGYQNPGFFRTAFRAQFGTSPERYRRSSHDPRPV